jgi:hypothetical protein
VRARDAFTQAQLRLQAAGCRYRIKEVARSPYVQVYETLPPRRQQSARGFRCDDEEGCWDLVALLLRADRSAASGGPGLDWSALHQSGAGAAERPSLLTWGELRATVQGWIALGGLLRAGVRGGSGGRQPPLAELGARSSSGGSAGQPG